MKILSSGVTKMMLFIMVWSIPEVGGKPMCDPEDNMYYYYQADRCLRCEHCLQGEEPISLEDWDIKHSNPEKGPTECRPCRKCQPGTFSDKRSFKCEPCRNCSLFDKYEVSQCTANSNTICDGVRPTTPSPVTVSTPKPNHQDQNKEGGSQSVIIAGIICVTVFVISLGVICVYLWRNKLCRKGKKESNEEDPETSASVVNGDSIKNGDHRINMESEDEQPLLSQNSCFSQSETNSLELEIRVTNPDQVDPCLASLPTDNKNLRDVETDGPSGNFSRRIRMDRQWSYPFDEKNKRDYDGVMQKNQPMTVIEQVSKDDVSVGSKSAQSILELTDSHLNSVSKYLVNGLFRDVARDLGLEEEDLYAVRKDCEKDNSIKETSYQVLLQIKRKRGKITADELESSIQKHDLIAWEKVHNVLHQSGSNEL